MNYNNISLAIARMMVVAVAATATSRSDLTGISATLISNDHASFTHFYSRIIDSRLVI
ncbi:MAG TPA: hypothetical protein VF172_08275 [Nitrososphaera sp.]|jgi:hypothetical protein